MVDEKSTKTIKLNFGFFAYASFALVMLKICGLLDWSWGWVLAPVYLMMAPVAVGLGILTVGLAFVAVLGVLAVLADVLDRR